MAGVLFPSQIQLAGQLSRGIQRGSGILSMESRALPPHSPLPSSDAARAVVDSTVAEYIRKNFGDHRKTSWRCGNEDAAILEFMQAKILEQEEEIDHLDKQIFRVETMVRVRLELRNSLGVVLSLKQYLQVQAKRGLFLGRLKKMESLVRQLEESPSSEDTRQQRLQHYKAKVDSILSKEKLEDDLENVPLPSNCEPQELLEMVTAFDRRNAAPITAAKASVDPSVLSSIVAMVTKAAGKENASKATRAAGAKQLVSQQQGRLLQRG